MNELFLPAQSFEQNMVAFRSELDSSQKAHGGVDALLAVLEENGVEVLDRDPPEDRAGLLHVGTAPGDKLPDLIGTKKSLVFKPIIWS